MTISDDDLKRIEALCDAASPAPWAIEYTGQDGYAITGPSDGCICPIGYEEDATFIAAARTDVPDLCQEVRKLRGERLEASEYSPTALKLASVEGLVDELLTQEADRRLLRSEIRCLKAEDIPFLEKQRDALRVSLASVTEALEGAHKRHQQQHETIDALRAENERLRKTASHFEDQRDAALAEPDAARASILAARTADADVYSAQVTSLRAENEALRREYTSATTVGDARIKELVTENESLREEVASWTRVACGHGHDADTLRSENESLRGLLREVCDAVYCDRCPSADTMARIDAALAPKGGG